MKSFGPIPSRRLGKSLGINNIPPKICTYSCAYCQQGFSSRMQIERQAFYDPLEIFNEVKERIELLKEKGEEIDYLSFVPDGEPTLDINLGKEIGLLKALGIKIAVITNASLLWKETVRAELAEADWVSVKIDSVNEKIWRKVDHPLRALSLETILAGIETFSKEFSGKLYTETMLIKGTNDSGSSLQDTAEFISALKPTKAYLSIPTRPPADKKVEIPDENTINTAYQVFSKYINDVELLLGYEGNDFAFSGNIEADILSTTSVHPMRQDAVLELLDKADADEMVLEKLVKENKLILLEYAGNTFYMRKLSAKYKR